MDAQRPRLAHARVRAKRLKRARAVENREYDKELKKRPKVAKSGATDAEDILKMLHGKEMAEGGRLWRKRKASQAKGEKRTEFMDEVEAIKLSKREKKKEKWGVNTGKGRLGAVGFTAPFEKKFWGGEDDEGEPDEALKLRRKALGVRVKGPCPAPIVSVRDKLLPPTFAELFNSDKKLNAPSTAQGSCWPAVLNGSDVLMVAPTGSGKTLGYLMPMIPHIAAQPPPRAGGGPIALVLVPTRELAAQVKEQANSFRRLFGLRTVALFGGMGKQEQAYELRTNAVHIVVATPGRLIDMLGLGEDDGGGSEGEEEAAQLEGKGKGKKGKKANMGHIEVTGRRGYESVKEEKTTLKMELPLDRVTMLVLDEADRMLNMGFEQQLHQISERVRPDRQTLLLSATFPQALREAAMAWTDQPVAIRVSAAEVVTPGEAAAAAMSAGDELRDAGALAKEGAAEAAGDGAGAGAGMKPALSAARRAAANASTTKSDLAMSNTVTHRFAVCSGTNEVSGGKISQAKADRLVQYLTEVRASQRRQGSVIVFCNRVDTVDAIVGVVNSAGAAGLGLKSTALHGQLHQDERKRAVRDLGSGKIPIAIATDLAARGLDVRTISHVVNFDAPRDIETFTHRVGRCGRAGDAGHAFSLFTATSLHDQHMAGQVVALLKSTGRPVDPALATLATLTKGAKGGKSGKASGRDDGAGKGEDEGEGGEGEGEGEEGLQRRLLAFYAKHNPDKIGDVEGLVVKYRNMDEAVLFAALAKKYAVQEAAEEDEAAEEEEREDGEGGEAEEEGEEANEEEDEEEDKGEDRGADGEEEEEVTLEPHQVDWGTVGLDQECRAKRVLLENPHDYPVTFAVDAASLSSASGRGKGGGRIAVNPMKGMVAPNSEATLSLTLTPPGVESKGKGKAPANAQPFSSTVRIAITYPASSGRASPIGTVELPCARAFATRGGGGGGGASCADGAMARLEQHAQKQRTKDGGANPGTARDEKLPSKKQRTKNADADAVAGVGTAREEVLRMNVRVLDLKVGNGKSVVDRKRVTVGYVGRLNTPTGKIFDQSSGKPFSFHLGKGEVIKGWDIGVQGMRVGGKRRITCPAAAAYGKKGTQGIPGGSTLVFDVTVADCRA